MGYTNFYRLLEYYGNINKLYEDIKNNIQLDDTNCLHYFVIHTSIFLGDIFDRDQHIALITKMYPTEVVSGIKDKTDLSNLSILCSLIGIPKLLITKSFPKYSILMNNNSVMSNAINEIKDNIENVLEYYTDSNKLQFQSYLKTIADSISLNNSIYTLITTVDIKERSDIENSTLLYQLVQQRNEQSKIKTTEELDIYRTQIFDVGKMSSLIKQDVKDNLDKLVDERNKLKQ